MNYNETRFIVAEWSPPSTQWDLLEILKSSGYKPDDVKEHWVKWGTLHLLMKDGTHIESDGGTYSDPDYKYPICELHYDEDFVEIEREER